MSQLKKFTIPNKDLRFCLPSLEKYFGVNVGYFGRELMDGWRELPKEENEALYKSLEEGDSLEKKYLDTDNSISLIFDGDIPNQILQLIYGFDGDAESEDTARIFFTLYLLAYTICTESERNKVDQDDFSMDFMNAEIKQSATRDLLRLYIYMKEREGSPMKKTKLVIKPSDGANIELENLYNWFQKRLITGLLENTDLIDGVETVDHAKELLKKLEHMNKNGGVGRPTDNPKIRIVSFGIYRMFNDYVKMSSPISDSLCDFINDYLTIVKVLESGKRLENSRIRTDIKTEADKMESGKDVHKFEEKGVFTVANPSEWGHYDRDWFPKMAKR